MRELFGCETGLSDHTMGIGASVAATALGAVVIEKHFTLNRTLKGTDHAFSLEPQGLQKMVRDLNRAALALGDGVKKVYETELAPLRKMGKMIVASKNLNIGHLITEADLEFRSPSNGLSPELYEEIIGKIIKSPVNQYAPIQYDNLQ
jgi:N-acetylneuraminate synthase/sialic acid synthase